MRTKLRNQPNRLNESDGHILHNGNADEILEQFIVMSLDIFGTIYLAASIASPITLMGINPQPPSEPFIEGRGYGFLLNSHL